MSGAEGRSVNVSVFESVKAFAGDRDLDEVAAEAVDSITDAEILEIQSLHRPPATIKRVLEATFMMLDAARHPNPKPIQDWAEVKTRIVQVGFLSSIKNYDVEVLRSKPYLVMFILAEYFDGENSLTYNRTRYANHATASLFKWCVATLVQASKEVAFDEDEEVEPEAPAGDSTLPEAGSEPKRKKRASQWRAPLSAVLAFKDLPKDASSQQSSAPQKSSRQGWRSPLTAFLAFNKKASKEAEVEVSQEELETDDEKSYPSSLGIMCCGCFILPLALLLLIWNERNVVCQTYSTIKVQENTIVADCSDAASVEGKLTFFSCPITQQTLHPMTPLTSFNVPGLQESIRIPAVAAAQKIEMYQCIEDTDVLDSASASPSVSALEIVETDHDDSKLEETSNTTRAIVRRVNRKRNWASKGDQLTPGSFEEVRNAGLEEAVRRTKTHSTMASTRYKMGWADVWYNSSEFKATPQYIQQAGCPEMIINGQVYNNPTLPDRGDGHPIELGKQVAHASAIVAGAFTFHDDKRIQKFTTDEQIKLAPFASQFGLNPTTDNIVQSINLNTVATHSETPDYLSTCNTERLGCIRMSYNKSSASHITVLGLAGGSGVMSPYTVEAPWRCGKDNFLRMWPEELSFDDAISKLKEENKAITWIIRIVGLLLAWLAICCVFNPIAIFADYIGGALDEIPVLDELFDVTLEGITAKLYCIISCSLGCSCGLLVIAIVWLAIRPITGGPLLASAIVLLAIAVHATKSHYDTMSTQKHKHTKSAQASTQQQPLMDEDDKKSS